MPCLRSTRTFFAGQSRIQTVKALRRPGLPSVHRLRRAGPFSAGKVSAHTCCTAVLAPSNLVTRKSIPNDFPGRGRGIGMASGLRR